MVLRIAKFFLPGFVLSFFSFLVFGEFTYEIRARVTGWICHRTYFTVSRELKTICFDVRRCKKEYTMCYSMHQHMRPALTATPH